MPTPVKALLFANKSLTSFHFSHKSIVGLESLPKKLGFGAANKETSQGSKRQFSMEKSESMPAVSVPETLILHHHRCLRRPSSLPCKPICLSFELGAPMDRAKKVARPQVTRLCQEEQECMVIERWMIWFSLKLPRKQQYHVVGSRQYGLWSSRPCNNSRMQ